MTLQLSDRAKNLIPKARIVNAAQLALAPEAQAILQAADDGGRYLTDQDLAGLGAEAENGRVAQLLRDRAEEIVTDARQTVLAQYPGITEPGGNLYPAMRAEACWRDFWHFLRCVTYGIATGCDRFTHAEGLGYMNELYQELKVPLPAMVTGLEALKTESLRRLPQTGAIAPYFDHLIEKMRAFAKAP